uniref:Serine/threonine-protein phosphatase n=1 Tax=Alexandrium monilatum TaxID=311494 RepID=A0A7S4SAC4_9DINO
MVEWVPWCVSCRCAVGSRAGGHQDRQDVRDAEAPVVPDDDGPLWQTPAALSGGPCQDAGGRVRFSVGPEDVCSATEAEFAAEDGPWGAVGPRRSISAPDTRQSTQVPRPRSSRSMRPSMSGRRVTACDIRLSRGLRASLGLVDAEEHRTERARAASQRWSVSLNPMDLAVAVQSAARSFRSVVLPRSSQRPGNQETSHGIRIEHVYDFYNPAKGRIWVRTMDADVIHKRPAQATMSQELDGGTSDGSEDALPREPSLQELPLRRRAVSRSNYELVSAWGVLVGHLLHSTDLDFHALTSAFVRKKMYSPENLKGRGRVLDSVRRLSRLVLDQAWDLCKEVAGAPTDMFDSDWAAGGLIENLFSTEYLDTLILIANAACKIFAAQPSVVEATAPCKVFGDLHGQLRELLLFFWAYGSPDVPDAPMFVFNGDFVDRGAHQVEVIGLLFALKVLLPERVWLVRGNHEERSMNSRYGFEEQCTKRLGQIFGPKVFDIFQKAFDQMPFACVIAGRILVVHGGLGSGTWRLDQLRAVRRPVKGDDLVRAGMCWVYDLLWSDPIEDDAEEQLIFGVHPSPRSSASRQISRFAWNVTKAPILTLGSDPAQPRCLSRFSHGHHA